MKLTNLIALIREEIIKTAREKIDYSNIKEDNFKRGITGYYKDIEFTFDAYDIDYLQIENLIFTEDERLPNIINKLNTLT